MSKFVLVLTRLQMVHYMRRICQAGLHFKMSYVLFTATIFTKIMATERDYVETIYNENQSDRSRHIQKASTNYFTILKNQCRRIFFTVITLLRQLFKMTSVAKSSLYCNVRQHDFGLWDRAIVLKRRWLTPDQRRVTFQKSDEVICTPRRGTETLEWFLLKSGKGSFVDTRL